MAFSSHGSAGGLCIWHLAFPAGKLLLCLSSRNPFLVTLSLQKDKRNIYIYVKIIQKILTYNIN